MKLDRNVRIVRDEQGMTLWSGEKQRRVQKEDEYILDALGRKITEAGLIDLVKKQENLCDLTAGLRLAQAVLDYGDFLAPAENGRAIEA